MLRTNRREIVARAKVTPEGRMSLPADVRKRHGLAQGGEVLVEDTGDAIAPRTLDQVVAARKWAAALPRAGREPRSMTFRRTAA